MKMLTWLIMILLKLLGVTTCDTVRNESKPLLKMPCNVIGNCCVLYKLRSKYYLSEIHLEYSKI